MRKTPDAATAAGPAAPVHQEPDPYAGQGGAYEIDKATGRRRLVERTDLPAAPEPTQPAAAENPKE